MSEISFGESQNWKKWDDIRDWAEKNGFKNLANRLQLNNDLWMSSGEFGRSQVEICDLLRNAIDEDDAKEIAKVLDDTCKENCGLW